MAFPPLFCDTATVGNRLACAIAVITGICRHSISRNFSRKAERPVKASIYRYFRALSRRSCGAIRPRGTEESAWGRSRPKSIKYN